MPKKIAVLGPGGTGSSLGGMLSKAGERVWMLDQWPEHIDALKTRGLRIAMGGRLADGVLQDLEADHRVPVRAYHLHQVCALKQQFDIAFLTSKSYDAEWFARLIEPYLAQDGYVVVAQGGLTEEAVASVVGTERVVGCALHADSWLIEPDVVWRSEPPGCPRVYTVGELDGARTSRIEELAQTMAVAGATSITSDIQDAKWSALAHDVATYPLAGLTGVEPAELAQDPAYADVSRRLGEEAVAVAGALGYAPELSIEFTAAPGHRDTVTQDLATGRQTEVPDALNGYVVRRGREAGVATPLNEAFVELFARLERGDAAADISNLKVLQSA